MKNILKIVGIFVFSAVLVLGLVKFLSGRGSKGKIDSSVDESVDVSPQEVTITTEGAVIKSTLEVKSETVLRDIELCLPPGRPHYDDFEYSNSCVQDKCESTVRFKREPPQTLSIYRMYQGNCVPQTIEGIQKYEVRRYSGKIALTPKMIEAMRISTDTLHIGKTPDSKFVSQGYARIGDNIVITVEYSGGPIYEDEFMFNSKVISVVYR